MINQTKTELHDELNPPNKRGRKKKLETISQPVKVLTASEYSQMIGPVIAFSGSYMATAAKWDGFKFSDEETNMLAAQAGEVAVELAPAIATREGKIIAFSLTAICIVGMKYMAYKDHLNEEARKKAIDKTIQATDN